MTSAQSRSLWIAGMLEREFGRPARPGKRANPLDSLIATLLSQNTNDRNSYRAWLELKRRYPTWAKVQAAPWKSVSQAIKVGGLRNQKARRIKEILSLVKRRWGKYDLSALRKFSNADAMEYLRSMKGVGRKTAACVLVFSLGRDLFPVDTHIHRICNRLRLVKTKNADETFDAMQELVPRGRAYSFHVNLISFGRQTCRSVDPRCGNCALFDECSFPRKNELASQGSSSRSIRDRDFLITRAIARTRNRRSTQRSIHLKRSV